MKRTPPRMFTTAISVAAAAAVALTGCSSGTTSQPAVLSSQPSSAPAGASGSAGAAGTPGADSTSTEPSTSVGSAAVTVSGTLDEQSATWFGAVCSSIAPMIQQVFTVMGSSLGAATSDPAKTQQQLVHTLNSMSDTLSKGAATLGSLPPPTMSNGSALASKVVQALQTAAPKLKQAADHLAAATITSADQLNAAMGSVQSTLDDSLSGLSLDEFELDPTVESAMKTVPACAPLYQIEQSMAPTS